MLSPAAQKVISDYLALPFENAPHVPCPYFNNKKSEVHGGLRATIGKGSPDDIAEEAVILSLQNKIDLNKLTAEEMTKFLVDHHLGVDCSAFVYYVLDAELQARGKGRIKNNFVFSKANFIRKLLIKLRTAENTSVKVFADDANSTVVPLDQVAPGDFLALLGGGPERGRDHIILLTDVLKENGSVKELKYVHSDEWPSDGRYGHGVRQGTMTVSNTNQSLLDQPWHERTDTDVNELFKKAGYVLEIRRLRALSF